MITHLRACMVAHAGTVYNIPRHAIMTHCTLQSLSGSRLLVHGGVQAIQELRHRPSPRRTAPRRHPLPITTRETSCGAHFRILGHVLSCTLCCSSCCALKCGTDSPRHGREGRWAAYPLPLPTTAAP